MLCLFTIDVIVCHVELVLFYNVQITNLTFVGRYTINKSNIA
jgi:hypothetical protein